MLHDHATRSGGRDCYWRCTQAVYLSQCPVVRPLTLTYLSAVCKVLQLPPERVNRDAMVHFHRSYNGHTVDTRDSWFDDVPNRNGRSRAMCCGPLLTSSTGLGREANLVEHMAQRGMGWYESFPITYERINDAMKYRRVVDSIGRIVSE